MINKDKQYRTRDGREVRIYATDNGIAEPIHGAINCNGVWRVRIWNENGKYTNTRDDNDDLIEVKPRIKREYWVNVYPEPKGIGELFCSKTYAKSHAGDSCIACVKVVIDCEEGEGL
jgi:hypothetical protein